LIVFHQKQVILAKAPEAQNKQNILEREIAKIKDKS